MSYNLPKYFLLVALAVPAVRAAPTDEIKVAHPRPMMILSSELFERHGYLVTYEDAPADPVREILVETRANGRQTHRLVWTPVTFHVNLPPRDVRPDGSPSSPDAEPVRQEATPSAKPGPDVIGPLLKEYNSSGNRGHFSAIYDGDYTHLVQDETMVDGKLVAFEPILSTVVPVNLQEGTCWDLVKDLLAEIQQARKVSIVNAFPPLGPWDTRTCSVSGHDLPARQALMQLLDQIAAGSGVSPGNRFLWTLVHDPNDNTYFFSTRMVPRPAEPATTQEKPQPQAQAPATGSKLFKLGPTPPVKEN